MRTTVELPPELMKQAKASAAAQGESLKALFTRAVARELGKPAPRAPGNRVTLPIFGRPGRKPVRISSKDIASALADDDAALARRAVRIRKK